MEATISTSSHETGIDQFDMTNRREDLPQTPLMNKVSFTYPYSHLAASAVTRVFSSKPYSKALLAEQKRGPSIFRTISQLFHAIVSLKAYGVRQRSFSDPLSMEQKALSTGYVIEMVQLNSQIFLEFLGFLHLNT